MRRADTPIARLRTEFARRRAYFTSAYPEVTELNVRNLRLACLIALGLGFVLTPIARWLLPWWSPSAVHVVFAPVAIGLIVALTVLGPRVKRRPYAGAVLCLAVEAIMLGWLVVIDAVFSPLAPGSLVQPAAIALAVLVATPWGWSVWTAAAAEVALMVLSFIFKPELVAHVDAFSAVVGFAVTAALSQLAMELRLRDFEARERYRELSEIDGLTGLLNKGALVSAARRAIERAGRSHGIAAVMVDIDDFKHVNDQFGHDEGDELLRLLAEVLCESFRATDAVGRFGGDEFMVVAVGLSHPLVVESKMNRVLEMFRVRGGRLLGAPVSASAGVVLVGPSAARSITYEALVRQADQALYEVKRASKGAFAVHRFEPEEPACERRADQVSAQPASNSNPASTIDREVTANE